MNVKRHFLLNESLLSGIVCHLPLLILEVCYPLIELSNYHVNFTRYWCSLSFCNVHCKLVYPNSLCIFCGYCYTAYVMCLWPTALYITNKILTNIRVKIAKSSPRSVRVVGSEELRNRDWTSATR